MVRFATTPERHPDPVPPKEIALGAAAATATATPTDPDPDPDPDALGSSPFGAAADTERLGDEIARLAAHLHAATHRLLVLIRAFDEREGWGWGFRSCADWLSWRTGIAPGAAREKVRVARALGSLPLISAAMARGEMSYSKVRAMTRVASPDNEEELLEVARHATASHIERLVRAWRRVDRIEEADQERERHRSRFLRLHADDDGMYVLRARLDPEVGALLEKALEWASDALYREEAGGREAEANGDRAEAVLDSQETTTAEQRRADGLGLLAERAMAAAGPKGKAGSAGLGEEPVTGEEETLPHSSRADRFQVILHVDAPVLGKESGTGEEGSSVPGHAYWADSGVGVPAETSRRLACDAGVVPMTHGRDGQLLDVGRKRRTVPPAIRRALEYRDRGCRFPGCDCRYTDAHHITHWADGGETKLDNLVKLCSRHHRAVHEEGFRVEWVEGAAVGAAAGGEARFYRSDGRPIPGVPESPALPTEPVEDLVQTHAAAGLTPDAWTPTPLWSGETFDYGLAIDMLRP
jgi:hypothetical protein